jgi:hypothetical protein
MKPGVQPDRGRSRGRYPGDQPRCPACGPEPCVAPGWTPVCDTISVRCRTIPTRRFLRFCGLAGILPTRGSRVDPYRPPGPERLGKLRGSGRRLGP